MITTKLTSDSSYINASWSVDMEVNIEQTYMFVARISKLVIHYFTNLVPLKCLPGYSNQYHANREISSLMDSSEQGIEKASYPFINDMPSIFPILSCFPIQDEDILAILDDALAYEATTTNMMVSEDEAGHKIILV